MFKLQTAVCNVPSTNHAVKPCVHARCLLHLAKTRLAKALGVGLALCGGTNISNKWNLLEFTFWLRTLSQGYDQGQGLCSQGQGHCSLSLRRLEYEAKSSRTHHCTCVYSAVISNSDCAPQLTVLLVLQNVLITVGLLLLYV